MTRQFPVSQERAIKAPEDASPLPKLLVSSEEVDWEGLVVRAYHEPAALEWIASGTCDSSLVLAQHVCNRFAKICKMIVCLPRYDSRTTVLTDGDGMLDLSLKGMEE